MYKRQLLRLPVVTENISSKTKLDNKATQLTVLLVVNHFVMVIIMAATPLYVQDIGETIQVVGTIISYHTLGMFVFSHPYLDDLLIKLVQKKYLSLVGLFS